MIPNQIISKNKGSASEYSIIHNAISSRRVDEETEEKAQKLGNALMAKYKAEGHNVWDGTYYRLDNMDEVRNGSKVLKLGTVKFSTHRGYKQLSKEMDLTENQYTNYISTAAIVKTSDNWYIFGKRGKTIHTSNIDLFGGGVMESEGIVETGNDLELNVFKELKEEANIDRKEVEKIKIIGILLSMSMNILFTFDIQLNTTREILENKFKDREDDEMSELIFMREEELEKFLKSLDSYRPLVFELMKS